MLRIMRIVAILAVCKLAVVVVVTWSAFPKVIFLIFIEEIVRCPGALRDAREA